MSSLRIMFPSFYKSASGSQNTTKETIMETAIIIKNNKMKTRLPGPMITTKPDGTIWIKGNPLLVAPDNMDKTQLQDWVKAKQYDQIPAEHFAKWGENSFNCLILTEEEWEAHPLKKKRDEELKEEARIEREKAAKTARIHLSSRGWGDYSPVEWTGDITRPDAEILAECRAELENGHDVDTPNQSDADLLKKIAQARKEWANKPAQEKRAEAEIKRLVDSGYCFNCESWCHGDCGRYSNDPETRYRREFSEANRKTAYGIQD